MKGKIILLGILLTVIVSLNVQGQEGSVRAGAASRIANNGTYLGTFRAAEGDVDLMPELRTMPNHVNKSQNQESLARFKDSMRILKRAGVLEQGASNKTTGSIDPTKTFGFLALGNQGTPSDNTIAVGRNGQIIAAVNSSLRVYNSNGSSTQNAKSFPLFWNPVSSATIMCDPLVHYDADFDRFIVFTQVCDRVTADNKILIAFSETNDAAGAYHYYSFKSNLREVIGWTYPTDVWFDYPKMAVSKSDLFISGNMFRNLSSTNSSFVESAVFQIDKGLCFAGTPSSATVWYDIANDPFTIVPAGHGRDLNYGDKMYLCATRNGVNSANNIRMYTIDGNALASPTMTNETISIPTYSRPADGVQQGTNLDLQTGDMRGMSAMYIDGTVHFVFHSNGPGGYVSINYNRFTKNGGNWVNQNKLISIPNVDCAFPSIASMGHTKYEQSALIVFNYSSLSAYPGVRAIFVDHNINISNYEELSAGTGYASVVPDNGTTRWGDYTGIARDHNASVPTVWGFGMFAVADHTWRNYIAKVEIGAWAVATEDVVKEKEEVSVFPNPVIDVWRVKLNLKESGRINIAAYDVQGKKVRDVLEGNVSKGESVFSFNKNGLANGTYFIKIQMNNKLISNEKIIVTK